MSKKILFVTDTGTDGKDGLSYAIELARMIDKGVAVLLVQHRRLSGKFESVMSAVTFAEAGEHETAREFLRDEDADGYPPIGRIFRSAGIVPRVYKSEKALESALTETLEHAPDVDMVLLSPNITMSGDLKPSTLGRLLRTTSIPIVTLTRQAQTA